MTADFRALWLAVILIFSVMIATAAALLARASGDGPAGALFKAGACFGATVLVLFAIFYFATADV
jgi:hypothetical protein